MASAAQRRLNFLSRWVQKPTFASIRSQPLLRRSVDLFAAVAIPKQRGAHFREETLAAQIDGAAINVPALWCGAGAPPNSAAPDRRVLLYFHGGAYTIGGPKTHKHLVAGLAKAAGVDGLLVDYRLAPEHPFPAAFDDARAAYQALIDQGWRGDQIALAGDSAGGGIALALLSHLLTSGAQKPACLLAFSPLTDLTGSGGSITSNAKTELMLPQSWLDRAKQLTLRGADPKDPRISPLFADFPNAPPSLIQVATGEILLDDSRRMAAKLEESSAEATLEEMPDVMHVWQLNLGRSPEADDAVTRAAAFLARHLRK